ncbi:hypothetical protein BDZ94DRAFT_906427 [Collybia nuda]|uniref:Uncharacterized protein n=1 Tax=Collybia nuda TaxID=64659 RepID=A0A9P6CPL5_9AGAR|nr:hypothetical protein BDZ94DRAFT_906427 [Collybia nuda]
MSQFPYLVGRSGLPVNHIPLDRYNYPPHDRAQPDLTPSHWLQPHNRASDYIQESGALVPQFSTNYDYSSSTRPTNNRAHVPTLTAAHPGWDVDPVPEQSSRVVPINPTDIGYPTQLNYHVPSHHSVSSVSPQLQSQAEYPPPTLHPSLSRSPSYSSQPLGTSQWDDDLYRIPESHSSGHSSAALTPSTPLVKMEQEEAIDPFVMEPLHVNAGLSNLSQSLAPPTEVPLRATQASPPMRRMMSVFRLNPFSIHSGGGKGVVQATWSGGEAHALDEEPLEFEFQLKLDGVEEPEAAVEPLRTFSPDFELHEDRGYGKTSDWGDEYQTESVYTTSTPPTWETEYPTSSEEHYSPSGSVTHSRPSSTSRLHHVTSHPYLRKSNSREASESYEQHHTSTLTGRDYLHRTRAPDAVHSLRTQARAGPSSRSSTYNFDESPGFNPSLLPSVTSANRRWSLPDNPAYPHAPFLVQG